MTQDNEIIDTGHALPKVIDVEYLGGHKVFVRFSDGKQGDVDFLPIVKEGVFQKLRDSREFARFGLERGTLVWNSQLDISPEFLYRQIH